jgi:hypothetical protein
MLDTAMNPLSSGTGNKAAAAVTTPEALRLEQPSPS